MSVGPIVDMTLCERQRAGDKTGARSKLIEIWFCSDSNVSVASMSNEEHNLCLLAVRDVGEQLIGGLDGALPWTS